MAEINDWSQYLRDFKIEIVSGERNIEITEEAKQRFAKELRFISEEFPEDIITGSLALNLYGLLDRGIGDIDIMIADRKRYTGYRQGLLYGMLPDGEQTMSNRLGHLEFEIKESFLRRLMNGMKRRSYLVDFFEADSAPFETFEFEGHTYKIHQATRIVENKCVLESIKPLRGKRGYSDSKEKHGRDLLCIFG